MQDFSSSRIELESLQKFDAVGWNACLKLFVDAKAHGSHRYLMISLLKMLIF
jgi:hypothetical protein